MISSSHYFKALADETRLRLLHILSFHELNVNELVSLLSMGQSRVSRHLKILTAASLLNFRRDGLWVFYSIADSGEPRRLITAILPFLSSDPLLLSDLKMATALMEDRANKTHHFFNSIAEDWDHLTTEILGDFDLPAAIVAEMPQCHVACDLGCGTGNMLLAMKVKSSTVIGVDGSARMLELAKRRFPPHDSTLSLRIGDLAHLPLRDSEADFVSLNMVLHHLPSPIDALREAYRVLKPHGILVISDFNSHLDENMRSRYGDHWLGFTKETLNNFLNKTGFSLTRLTNVSVRNNHSLHILTAEKSAAAIGK